MMGTAHATDVTTAMLQDIHRYQLILSRRASSTCLALKSQVGDFREKSLRIGIHLELLVV